MDRFNNIDKHKRNILIIIAITLLGELYFYPINGEFRFTVSVIAFSLVILLFDDLKITKLSIYTAISTILFRSILGYISTKVHIIDTFILNFPSSMYYVLFGILVYLFNLNKNKENTFLAILSLFSIDALSNIGEGLLRGNLSFDLFRYILIIGLIRSVVSYSIYALIKNHENIIRGKEHRERYIQLNTLVSNIQAEMFYLKKSMVDIENVMSKSYSLYERNKENSEIKDNALDIAREVHEIKKDYYRVLSGFESFLSDFESNDSMSFKDIAFIIEKNAKRHINNSSKNIELNFIVNDSILISTYYSFFTILNNLIANSIDAIEGTGKIIVIEKIDSGYLTLTVFDNGHGIDEDLIPYIFNPGFTTKFDKHTGNSSTGIGLSHVNNIVNDLKGTIKVESNIKGTTFTIMLPINKVKKVKKQ